MGVDTRYLLVTDRKAGHKSLARGVVHLDRTFNARNVHVDEIEIALRAKFLSKVLRWLVMTGAHVWLCKVFGGTGWLRFFYRNVPEWGDQDIVLSAGGDSLYLNVIYSKFFNKPNVFVGSLRGLDSRLVAIPVFYMKKGYENECVVDVLPAPISYQDCINEAERFLGKHKNVGTSETYWAVLIGGSIPGYRFRVDSVRNWLSRMCDRAESVGAKLLITTSRRTDRHVTKAVSELVHRRRRLVSYYVNYSAYPEKVVRPYLGLADIVYCTEDSASMISEAVVARKPVVTVRPENSFPDEKMVSLLSLMESLFYIKRVVLGDGVVDDVDWWRPVTSEKMENLAKRLLEIDRAYRDQGKFSEIK